MSTVIYKYPFPIENEFLINFPVGGRILHVEVQDGIPCMWVQRSSAKDLAHQLVRFYIHGTGHPIPVGIWWVGTFQMPPFVWHLFVEGEDKWHAEILDRR